MQATSLLTDKQRTELNRSVLAYLANNSIDNNIIDELSKSLNCTTVDKKDEAEIRKQAQVLEKKWTSVVRLQRKVLDLESQISTLKDELENSTQLGKPKGKNDPNNWLPRAPATYSLSGHRQPITAVAFHRIFNVLASAGEDGTIKIWDWEHGELEQTIKGHTKSVVDIDFDDSSSLLASCSSDLTIKLWDSENDYSNVRTLTGHDHTISGVRFVPGGVHLVSCSRDKTIRIWDVKSGYAVRTIQGAHSDWIKTICPSLDGGYVVSGGIDQMAKVTQLSNGETKLQLIGHDHVIECAIFAPQSAYQYLCQLENLEKPIESQFSSSFEYIATASRDKTIKIWNSRQELIKTLVGHDNWVRQLVFHPCGKYLISVSDDKTIRCWDLSQQGRCVKVINDAHQHFVSCVQWVPNIRTNDSGSQTSTRCVLATGSVDLQVKIWAD